MKEIWDSSCLFWANRERNLILWLLEWMELVRHPCCGRGWETSAGTGEIPSARGTAPASQILQMATSPPFSSSPRQPGLGSAWSNHVGLLIISLSFGINCGPNPGDPLSLTHTQNPFSFDSQEFEFDGWTAFSLYFFITVNCNFWPA